MASCSQCEFFMSRGLGVVGECRRYPNSRQCAPSYWCGEFRSRFVSKPAPGYNPPPPDLRRPARPTPAPPRKKSHVKK